MKKLLLALVGILLLTGTASAQWNLRQNPTGTPGTYWIHPTDGREEHVLVTHIIAEITDVTLPVSTFITSPITGYVEAIYATIHKALSGPTRNVITFFTSTATRGASFTTSQITDGVSGLTLESTGSAIGDRYLYSPTLGAAANRVCKGCRISISSDGAAADDASGTRATFVIVINPR